MTPVAVRSEDIAEALANLGRSEEVQRFEAEGWLRTYGRIAPTDDPLITLVYERPERQPVRLDVHVSRHPGARRQERLGWVSTTSCLDDRALPTLRAACAEHACTEIVRYRPGKRCTFRGIHDGKATFVKVVADERGDRIASDAYALERIRNRLDFRIADCLGWNGMLKALSYAAIPGHDVTPLLSSAGGVSLAGRIGDALASLPLTSLETAETFAADDQMKRTAKYSRNFALAAPALAGKIKAFIEALRSAHRRAADTQLRPIHGSPHSHQWLLEGDSLALIDFDRVTLGPVELDAATFLAELDFESGGLKAEADAFLAHYERRVGGVDTLLLATYRAHKHFAKAFKAALSVDVSREVRADRILDFGLDRLAEAAS